MTNLSPISDLSEYKTAEQSRKGKRAELLHKQVDEQVSEQVVKVLLACQIEPWSKAELLEVLGLANAYMNYRRHLFPLIEQGFIEMTIPDKPNSRMQKYRITANGLNLMNSLSRGN